MIQWRRDSFGDEIKQSQVQARQRGDALRNRIKALEDDIGRIKGQVRLQSARVSLAAESLSRYSKLYETNYISVAQLQDKQAEFLDQKQRLADLSGIQSSAQRQLQEANAELRDLIVQSEREEEASAQCRA